MATKCLMISNTCLRLILLEMLLFAGSFWSYTYVADVFGYENYIDRTVIENIPLSIVLIAICQAAIRKRGSVSYYFLHFCLIFLIIPSMVLYCRMDIPVIFPLLTSSAFILMAVVTSLIVVPRINVDCISFDNMMSLLAFLSVLFIVVYYLLGGYKHINFDISLVYLLRDDARAALPDIFAFLVPIFSRVVIPVAIVGAMMKKQWLLLLILSICSVLMFAMSAVKAPLFIPLVLLFFYWASQSEKMLEYMLISVFLGIIVGCYDLSMVDRRDIWEWFGWFGGMFVRGTLLVSARLNSEYIRYFSTNEPYYWSMSKLTFGLVDPPVKLDYVNVMGIEIFNDPDAMPNVGWIGSGFSNARFIGVYVYSVLIALLLSFLDSYAKKHGRAFIFSIFVINLQVIFMVSDLPTSFITHGTLSLLIILVLIQPRLIVSKYSARGAFPVVGSHYINTEMSGSINKQRVL